jgi:hypothetical protein
MDVRTLKSTGNGYREDTGESYCVIGFLGSFRGACVAREPGIYNSGAVVIGSGLAASAAPRNDY